MIGVSYVFCFDHEAICFRYKILYGESISYPIGRILRHEVYNPRAEHKVQSVLNSRFVVQAEQRSAAPTPGAPPLV